MAPTEWDPLLPSANRQTGRNYTGILTKTIVYGITLVLFLVGGCSLSVNCDALRLRHRRELKLKDIYSLRIHPFIHYPAQLGQL